MVNYFSRIHSVITYSISAIATARKRFRRADEFFSRITTHKSIGITLEDTNYDLLVEQVRSSVTPFDATREVFFINQPVAAEWMKIHQ